MQRPARLSIGILIVLPACGGTTGTAPSNGPPASAPGPGVADLAGQVGGCQGAPPERTVNADPSNYQSLVPGLGPGDRLLLVAGNYTDGLTITGLNGAPGRCIVIEGPGSGPPAVIQPEASLCCNTVSISDSSYLALRHLEIDSQDFDGIDGIKAESTSASTHHINLEDLFLHGQDGSQQTVGISTKCPSWNWVVRRTTILAAGTGMYFGNSDGSAELVASLIEFNLVRDTIGYSMQIKQQNARSTGLGAPDSGVTTIRHNVFSKAGSTTSPPDGARPNLLVDHWPLSGSGSSDHYEIYGNFFYENPTEALFQGTGRIAFYDNVLLNDFDSQSGANFQFHEGGGVRDLEVFHNTIVASGPGISVSGVEAGYIQLVRGNAVFAAGSPKDALQLDSPVLTAGNVTDAYANAGAYLVAPRGSVGAGLDFYPLVGTLTGPPIDSSGLASFRDWDRDFNGTARDLKFRGAYSGEGKNPGWPLSLMIQPGSQP
jgi:hypothetical protein